MAINNIWRAIFYCKIVPYYVFKLILFVFVGKNYQMSPNSTESYNSVQISIPKSYPLYTITPN